MTETKKIHIKIANPLIPVGPYRNGLKTPISKILPYLSQQEKEDLLNNKLLLHKEVVDEAHYIQSACELTVCSWFAHVASQAGGTFKYEPAIAPPKDVDCSILHEGYTFNIEVKCANYQKQKGIVAGSELVVHGLGRMDDYGGFVSNLQDLFGSSSTQPVLSPAHHMDCKMKDYLLSAQEKFGTNVEKASLNILFVCVDDQMDMTKWISYLKGPRGLFTTESFEPCENYSNVDMVVLTNLYHRHSDIESKFNISEHWNLSKAFNFAVINPATTKRSEIFSHFSSLVPLDNADLIDFLQKSEMIPDGLESALGLSYFVIEQKKQGVHKFQGYATEEQRPGK